MLEINVNLNIEGIKDLAEAIMELAKSKAKLAELPVISLTEGTAPLNNSTDAVVKAVEKKAKAKQADEKAEPTSDKQKDEAVPAPAPEKTAPEQKPTQDNASKNNAAMLYKLSEAGASLLESGKMNELITLLHTFHVEAVTMLKPEQYDDFARGLRSLGAMI